MTTIRITDDWLPLPDHILKQLGWKEGDLVELEIKGNSLEIRAAQSADAQPTNGRIGIRTRSLRR
jgi:antitoxin component of MazEF toxin-antitoxin module